MLICIIFYNLLLAKLIRFGKYVPNNSFDAPIWKQDFKKMQQNY